MELVEYNRLQVSLFKKYNVIGSKQFLTVCSTIAKYRVLCYSQMVAQQIEEEIKNIMRGE